MSRWDGVMKLLPRCLRDPTLLDNLTALDAQVQAEKFTGSFSVEAHYRDGQASKTKLVPPVVTFDMKAT